MKSKNTKDKSRLVFWRSAIATILVAGSAQANLLPNGGFEDTTPAAFTIQNPPVVDTASITGWRIFNTDATAMTFEVVSDSSGASEGNNYLKVTSIDSAPGLDGGVDTARPGVLNNLSAGVTYRASFDLQHVSNTNSVAITLNNFYENNGALIENFVTETLYPTTGTWSHYSYEITPTEDGVFYFGFRPKVGTALVDEVFLLDNAELVAIPEPASLAMVGFAASGLIALRRLMM